MSGVNVYFGTDQFIFYGPFRDVSTARRFAEAEGAGEPYRMVAVETIP